MRNTTNTEKKYVPTEDGAACSRLVRLKHHIINKKRILMTVVTAVMLVALTAVSLQSQVCYAVSVNGESVGAMRNRAELDQAVSSAEQELTHILGYSYSFSSKLNVTTSLSSTTDDAEELEELLISSVPTVTEKYAVKIDGSVVAALDSDSGFQDMLDGFVSRYASAGDNAARIIQNVSLEYTYVSVSDVVSLDELSQMLDPANTSSEYSLSVRTTSITQRTDAVPYETTTYEDGTVYQGETVVVTPGADGADLNTVCTSYINGRAVAETIIDSQPVTQPVTQVVAVGTEVKPSTASNGYFICPVTSGTLTSGFGSRSGGHQGIDICGDYGQDIMAADGGEVIYADWMEGYGNYVQIRHDDGTVTAYGHCSELLVSVGERVAQGQVIAHMGSTGNSSADHVHFEVIVGGTHVDPLGYLTSAAMKNITVCYID